MSISVTSHFGSIVGLAPISSDEAKSNVNSEIKDKCGSVVKAFTIEGQDKPTNTYSVTDDVTWGDVELGGEISGNVVTNVSIDTNAGDPPSVNISGESVGSATPTDGATNIIATIAAVLTEDSCAQAMEGAPDTTGNCHLQKCSANYSIDFKRILGNTGTTAKYTLSNPRVEVSAEYQSTDTSAPTAPTATDTLVITQPATIVEDVQGVKRYKLAFIKYL
jgi:hypothetical protein